MFRRTSHESPTPTLRHYPDAQFIHLHGRHAGQVNFSHLPPVRMSKEAEPYEAAVGQSLGAIRLPLQRGMIVPETPDENRRALTINVFRDTATNRRDAYLLASDVAIEAQGRHRSGQNERGVIATLTDGDILPVGKNWWLPLVGHNVSLLENDEQLARVYNGVHSDQGAFHVRNGDLFWIDSGRQNRSVLIQDIKSIRPEHLPYQEFLPAGRLAMSQIVAMQDTHVQTTAPPHYSPAH